MNVQKDRNDTGKGPEDWFTGDVYIDTLKKPSETNNLMVGSVNFTPGARTAWHTHPFGQTLIVTDGVGLVSRRGSKPEEILPGDVVVIEPGEEHWHGAAPTHRMTHIAINAVDEQGVPATWGDHVTDEEYADESL